MNRGYRIRPFFACQLLSGVLASITFSAGGFAENIPLAVPSKAHVIDPKDEFCLSTLGVVHYQLKRFDEAPRTLTRALIINPDNLTARDYLSLIASRKELRPSTVTDGAKSPEDTFLAAYIAFRKAEKLEQDGQAGEAIQTYKEADKALAELSNQHPKWNPAIVEYTALKKLQP